MTRDEIKQNAMRLLMILGLLEAVGWSMIVLPLVRAIVGPFAAVSLALGITLVIACLIGAIWTSIQLAKLK